ncbi:uncharacterized protein BKA55DRAFT_545969 [Fusarium redolens]|uniref:Heterokaryon incompatibility domain-containing protein n=1 Tax=Fusarium redolens TaxID=48865 RepID=A0A9P9JRD0_FUSRE|nr:uncharacterized protein BKA55DRAFT_545969 [Fusarium redolens]KAH7224386.1 hypothetical protein BKA55DRAFT_545969 [Fusarium redolens]
MDNWHTAQCKKPDIAIFPGLDVPTCMNCGGICPSDRADNKHNDELQIPSPGKRSAMQLNWPPSMSYQDYAYRHDPNGLLHKALVSQVDQGWCDKGPDKHMPCSSITKSSQSPSSQVSNTSYESLDARVQNKKSQKWYRQKERKILHHMKQFHIPGPKEMASGKRTTSYSSEIVGIYYQSLRTALMHLQNCRLDDQDRCLWVDAICINQSDVSERTHQVGMMREIYSTASRVLIYLGIGDAGSGSEFTHDPEILSGNSYFSRIWVVQEIASAKQALVLYDRQAMHWSFFHRNLWGLPSKRWMRHFGSPRQIDDAHGFLTLLGDTRDCNASDPRDKIFALLGLWKSPLEPDYKLSPQAVYTGLASSLVTDENHEVAGRLLDMATHGRSMIGLPSWVPDWSVKSQQPYQRQWSSCFDFPMKSLPKGDGRFRVHRQTGSLCVLAAKIDTLAPYLSCGFRSSTNGLIIVEAGCIRVSLTPEVLRKCEPNDRIFRLSGCEFCLILREKADPDIYIFIGLCGYSLLLNGQHPPIELDAIRYLQDWAWLLSLGERRFWSDFATWETTQICWLALRRQRKLETQAFLQRVVRKAHFLKKSRDLATEERHAMNNYNKDKDRLTKFFQRQWMKTYKRWQQADELLVVQHKERRSVIRKLLPGYRSLESLQGTSTQPPLGQSMWLPVSFSWFGRKPKSRETLMGGPIDLHTEYPLLAACASRNIPLPPLHLITDIKSHITLSLDLELENGIRQLQRLALERFPQEPLADEKLVVSYDLKTSYRLDFKEKEWAIFLHWLSRPMSPSYDKLRYGLRMDVPLIWEVGFVTQGQLDEAHKWLDDNFDHYIKALSSSSSTEASLNQFFELIYCEQFELLWLFVFRSYSTFINRVRGVPRNRIGAELARAFFWRFNRSINKACQVVGKGLLTDERIEEQWTKFLDWLTQRSFKKPVRQIPSKGYDERPRLLVKEENSGTYHGDYCLNKIKYHGLFIVPKTPEPPLERSKGVESLSHPQPQVLYEKPRLPDLIQSEIRRRRLAERVFAFLFNDTEDAHQPTKSEDRDLEELLAYDQPSNCGEPFIQRWRQEAESWKAVEQYISKSQWYMSGVKMDLLRGSKEDGDMYREIVIV